MEQAWYGCITAGISTAICYPLDSLKTSLQSGRPIVNYYRGILPELVGAVPSGMVYWYSYSTMRDKGYDTFASSICGAIMGNFIDTPFDILKKQRQLAMKSALSTALCTKFGMLNVAHSVCYNSIYMPLLNYLMKEKEYNKTFSIFLCCCTANTLTYPIDRWRTKVVYGKQLASWYKGLGYRLMYGNLYSGMYMHLYLWLSDGRI